MHHFPILRGLCAAFVLLASAGSCAQAACPPGLAQYRYVGPSSDSRCTDTTIQAAIDNVTCPDAVVVVAHGATFTGQHLDIDNKSLSLVGSSQECGPPGACTDDCPPPPTAPVATISGSGHSGDSVVWIHGASNVTLRYLTIRDGSNLHGADVTFGGGIHFAGDGHLTLDTSTVTDNIAVRGGGLYIAGNGAATIVDSQIANNQADYGGGVYAYGTGSDAELVIGHGTQVIGNSAGTDGGGVVADGVEFTMESDRNVLFNNHAPNGNGGGLLVTNHDGWAGYAWLRSPGLPGIGPIYGNDARNGGGVAVVARVTDSDVKVEANSSVADSPVVLRGNSATQHGGAIYAMPYGETNQSGRVGAAYVNLFNHSEIVDNAAAAGAAVYLDYSSYFFGTLTAGSRMTMSTGRIVANLGWDGSAVNDGAIVHVADGSDLAMRRVEISGNEGGPAIRGASPLSISLKTLLLADNLTQSSVLHGGSADLPFEIRDLTIAGNDVGGASVVELSGSGEFRDSILYQPGKTSMQHSGGTLDARYIVTSERASIDGGSTPYVLEADPLFVDPAQGNYRLRLSSPALDFAPADADNPFDLDGMPRDVDLPGIVNFNGPRDAGAYELARVCGADDSIFCDTFESF